ncbi:MAG: hypothetical protein KatS3mg108_1865 [Isosphaeraceae bacterium]|jgi:NADH-quinone oxidoreductase subunit N|nr:MAG: hypothetical protein KatS3mg108_1865 [Isosphaeraceae bacterium]
MPTTTPQPLVPLAREWLLIAPELWLALWGLVVLLADVAFFRDAPSARRARFLGILALDGTLIALLLALARVVPSPLGIELTNQDYSIFGGTLAADPSTAWLSLAVLILLSLLLVLSPTWDFTDHWGEFFALVLWSTVAMLLLIAAEELLTLFLALETMTLCLYVIAALERDRKRSSEAGLKYFVYGSVASAFFLFGLSLIFGLTGTTRLHAVREALVGSAGSLGLEGNIAGSVAVLLVLVGLGFKLAAVPFHAWAPDTYEGAPAPAASWIATGSKLASFVAATKILAVALGGWAAQTGSPDTPGWALPVALISAASMTLGNLAALSQRNFKRLLAYSSIAQAGYVLVGVVAAGVSRDPARAVGAVLFYMVTYSFATLGAFAVAAWLARDLGTDELDDLDGLGRRRPIMALCLLVLMLSLIGLPPFAGFFGKLALFMSALETGESGRLSLTWLVALGLINSAISAYYYVRVLRAMYLRPARGDVGRSLPSGVFWPLTVGAAVALFFGLIPGALFEPMQAAAVPLLASGEDPRGLSPETNPFATRPTEEDAARARELRRQQIEQGRQRLQPGTPGA